MENFLIDSSGKGLEDACARIIRIPAPETEWEAWRNESFPTKLLRYELNASIQATIDTACVKEIGLSRTFAEVFDIEIEPKDSVPYSDCIEVHAISRIVDSVTIVDFGSFEQKDFVLRTIKLLSLSSNLFEIKLIRTNFVNSIASTFERENLLMESVSLRLELKSFRIGSSTSSLKTTEMKSLIELCLRNKCLFDNDTGCTLFSVR